MRALVKEAQEAYTLGRPRQAEELCRRALDSDARNASACLLLGTILCRTQRLDEAAKVLNAAVTADPNSIEGWVWLSTTYRRLQRFEEALKAAQHAADLAPENADAYSKLGQVLFHLERLPEARSALEASCRLDASVVSPQNNLGLVYLRLGLESEAEAAFLAALSLDPAFAPSLISLARLLVSKNRYAEAAIVAREGLDRLPNEAELHCLAGQALLAVSVSSDITVNTDAAEWHLRRSIELNPANSTALALLGMLSHARGRFDEARVLFERSIELDPAQSLSYAGLTRAKKIGEADKNLIDQMELQAIGGTVAGKGLVELHLSLGKAYDDLGDAESAMRHYDEANRIGLDAYLNGRPFDRPGYAEFVDWVKTEFTKSVMARAVTFDIEPPAPILIVGTMRSGTTLLEQILSSHPDVTPCGELTFWHNSGVAAYKSHRIPDREASCTMAEGYAEALRSASGLQAPFATDKLPHQYENLGLILLAFPNAPIIYCKRNAVDTCLSIYITPNSTPPDFAFDKGNITFMYEQHLKLMAHWCEVLPPGRIFEVNYEELVEGREPILRRLLAYCGLEWNDACLQHEKNDRLVRTPSSWQVRQPIYTGAIGRWKRYEPWLGEFAHLVPLG